MASRHQRRKRAEVKKSKLLEAKALGLVYAHRDAIIRQNLSNRGKRDWDAGYRSSVALCAEYGTVSTTISACPATCVLVKPRMRSLPSDSFNSLAIRLAFVLSRDPIMTS